jgi:hypothetical protein
MEERLFKDAIDAIHDLYLSNMDTVCNHYKKDPPKEFWMAMILWASEELQKLKEKNND